MCIFYTNGCCQRRRVVTQRINDCCTRQVENYVVPRNGPCQQCQKEHRGGVAVSLNAYNVTVGAGAMVPIMQTVATGNGTIDAFGNTVTLQEGAYLVTFGGNATAGDIQLALFANGATLVGEVATQTVVDGGTASASRTILFNATTVTTFALYNQGEVDTTFVNVGLTIVRLG